jgi:hypothetical protein
MLVENINFTKVTYMEEVLFGGGRQERNYKEMGQHSRVS